MNNLQTNTRTKRDQTTPSPQERQPAHQSKAQWAICDVRAARALWPLGLAVLLWLQACPAPHRLHTAAGGLLQVQTIAPRMPPKKARWDALLPKKRQTLAVFMTTWCDSCKRKQPAVLRWAKDNARVARTVFIVSGSPLKEVTAMTTQRKIPSPLVLIVNDQRGDVAKRYNIRATPTYMLLAPSGKILGRWHNINDVPDAR